MTQPARQVPRGRPQLTIVRGTRAPVTPGSGSDWRRLADAVLACTQELTRHLLEHRWVRVDEVLNERRELLAGMGRLPLDAEGFRCLVALRQAAEESDLAIASMTGRR